jgi:hypothetical protein
MGGLIDREPKGYCASQRSRASRLMRRVFVLDPLISARAGRTRFAAVVTVLLAVSILIGVSFLSVSKDASAGITKNVRGHIYDQSLNPIGGANVTVKAIRGGITMDTLWYDFSEADGFYTVTFGDIGNNLEAGDTIEVTARYSGFSSTSSAIADSGPLQTIDVTISGVVIPEFGALSLATVCGAFVAIFILIGRRRTGS